MKRLIVLLVAITTFASTAFAQLGSATTDLVFTPVTPCRIFDTRPSQGGTGSITANGTKSFIVWGSNFSSQGGAATNCGITASGNTTGVAVNLTVVAPAAGGFITAFPYGVTKPQAATVNFNPGDIRGNFAIVQIPAGVNSFDMSIYSTSTTDVVGDIVGFYSKPVATALQCVDSTPVTAAINQGPVNSLYYALVLTNACAAGYTEVAMRCTTDNAMASATAFSGGSSGYCGGNANISSYTLSGSRSCCRVPGR